MVITDVVSKYFRMLDERRHLEYRGGFEPIPDIVIRPEVDGDWWRGTGRRPCGVCSAIEVKASERKGGRLRAGKLGNDVFKLEALRVAACHKASVFCSRWPQ